MKIFLLVTLLIVNLFGGAFNEGLNYYKNKQYDKALESFIMSGTFGNSAAQFNVGVMYERTPPSLSSPVTNSKKDIQIFLFFAPSGF